MRISDWSSVVCSSDLIPLEQRVDDLEHVAEVAFHLPEFQCGEETRAAKAVNQARPDGHGLDGITLLEREQPPKSEPKGHTSLRLKRDDARIDGKRSEEHTSELQSLMRISYAVFCLKKKKNIKHQTKTTPKD